MSRRGHGEEGAGSALAVAVLAAVLIVTATSLPLLMAFAESRRLAAVADAAALAAADTASGAIPGVPCEAAAAVASISDVALEECRLDGATATVAVSAAVVGVRLEARARAGPPGSR